MPCRLVKLQATAADLWCTFEELGVVTPFLPTSLSRVHYLLPLVACATAVSLTIVSVTVPRSLPTAAHRCQETADSLNVVSGHGNFHYADSDIVRRLVVGSAFLVRRLFYMLRRSEVDAPADDDAGADC